MDENRKQPLCRKVNTKTHNVHHNYGGKAKYDRNTKKGLGRSLKKDVHRGLDYTPLYKFLHSKEGQDWDVVYSEAKSRIPTDEAIYDIVQPDNTGNGYSRIGESSYLSTMYVDEGRKLRFVKPALKNEDFRPYCPCCTHTFNGKVFIHKYDPEAVGW